LPASHFVVDFEQNSLMDNIKPKLPLWRIFALSTLGIGFFGFIWPTPYEYTRKYPDVNRINRFTGVKEISTSAGWKTKAQIDKENGDSQRAFDKKYKLEQEENISNIVVIGFENTDGYLSAKQIIIKIRYEGSEAVKILPVRFDVLDKNGDILDVVDVYFSELKPHGLASEDSIVDAGILPKIASVRVRGTID